MLTAEERADIAQALAHAEKPRAAVSDALKAVQRRRGWVSDEALRDVAAALGLSTADVDGVASFYSGIYRRRVGRHVILLCDGVSCWLTGFHPCRAHLRARLGIDFGETTPDGRFTLLPVACLGVCEQAPAMMIDSDVHGNLTPDATDEILMRYA